MSTKNLCYEDMPNITFKTQAPIFIIGIARSGTTILLQLMRKYLNINFGPESQFIIHFYKHLKRYGDLSNSENMDRLIGDVAKEACFVRWNNRFGFSLNTHRLKEEIKEPTFQGVLNAIFQQFANFAGRTRWGDKTPDYIFDLPILDSLFPEAQYVHIIRDGRDVALSHRKSFTGFKNFIQCALAWEEGVKLGQTFGAKLPASRYCELRYEELMQDPVKVMTGLAGFVQIEDGFDKVIDRIRENVKGDLLHDNCFKWKHKMTSSQIKKFEKAAGDELADLGYEVTSSFTNGLNPLEKAISLLDDYLRYFFRIDYMKDQISKLSTRLRLLRR